MARPENAERVGKYRLRLPELFSLLTSASKHSGILPPAQLATIASDTRASHKFDTMQAGIPLPAEVDSSYPWHQAAEAELDGGASRQLSAQCPGQ